MLNWLTNGEFLAAIRRHTAFLFWPTKTKTAICFGAFLCFAYIANAQTQPGTGFPPFSSIQQAGFDGVNLQTLDVAFLVPVVSHPGRGLQFNYNLAYNSIAWQPVRNSSGLQWGFTDGWSTNGPIGTVSSQTSTIQLGSCQLRTTNNYTYTDPSGTSHLFPLAKYLGCSPPQNVLSGYALDASGYFMDANGVHGPDGTRINFATTISLDSSNNLITQNPTITDANGNQISSRSCAPGNGTNPCLPETDWTDSLGQIVLKILNKSNVSGLISEIDYSRLAVDNSYQTIAVKYEFVSVQSNFGCTGVAEYSSASTRLVSEIDLPNGQKYSFTYEPTPGFSGTVTGRIQQVKLPSGGTVTYGYPGANGGINCSDGSTLQLSRTISDGTTSSTWTYSRVPNNKGGSTTVTAPQLPYDTAANQTVITFDATKGFETSRKIYQGSVSGSPIRTINTTWTNNAFNNTPLSQTIILEDQSTQTQTETAYDTNGLLLTKKEHDWGTGAPGPVIRVTNFSYLNAPSYTGINIINKVVRQTVVDGSGATKARTDMTYDDAGFVNAGCVTGALSHDDANFGCSYTTRGLLTSVTTYADAATPSAGVTKTFQYDSVGNLIAAQLDCCQQKQWTYSSATQFAFPDSIVSGASGGPQLITSFTYFVTTGQTKSITDENGKITAYSYQDSGHLDRLTDVLRPDAAHITKAYDDVLMKMTTSTPVQGTDVIQNVIAFDGLGRTATATVEDKNNNVFSIVETQYDQLGRAFKSSNPHTGSPQYWTTNQFDALGRPTSTTLPDGAQGTFIYTANAVTSTDPAGKQRRSLQDGAGRLIEVDEPGDVSAGAQASGSISIPDPLGNIAAILPASGSGSLRITGGGGQHELCVKTATGGLNCHFVSDTGSITVNVVVNGVTISKSSGYRFGTAAHDVASDLATQFNKDPNFANATVADNAANSSTLTWQASATGSATNYSFSASVNGADFSTSPTAGGFTGGSNGRSGATDSGALNLRVGNFNTSICYGVGCSNTAAQAANAFASALSSPGSPVHNVSVSGSTITMTANQLSAAWNVPITITAVSTDPADFPNGSFASQGALSGGIDQHPSDLAHPYVTNYQYDVMDNPIQAVQGAQVRTSIYDGMGRITDATTPEGGHESYQYNSFNLVTQRTDARGVITNYGFDNLNRLQTISYNVGTTGVPATPSIGYHYGTDPVQNNNGRLIQITDGLGSEAYSYDVMGRPIQLQKVINGTKYTIGYSYNSANQLSQIVYPSGRIVQQSFDAVGRLCEVAGQTSGCGTAASPYATAYGYNDGSQMTGFAYGNGIVATFDYSADRLLLTNVSYKKGTQDFFDLGYSYSQSSINCPNAPAASNGQIQCVKDKIDDGRTVVYAYDQLGRLTSATSNGSVGYPAWSLAFTYDRYGNRTNQAVVAGSAFPVSSPVDPATNRLGIAPYSYDLSGNLINDGNNALKYDAENRLISSSQSGAISAYSYDCKGFRVLKSSTGSTVVYIFSGNKVLAEYANGATVSSPTREYIYSGTGLLAKIESGSINYYHTDHLSTRFTSDMNANPIGQQGLYPFGDPWYESGTTSNKKFTGYERDSESGNDYALARFHINRVGRFASPDLMSGFSDNPQSLNRYSYAGNDPINLTDPTGMFVVGIDRFLSGWGNFGNNGFFGENWDEFFFLDNPLQVGTATLYHSGSENFHFEDMSSNELAVNAQEGELSILGQWPIYQYVFLNFAGKRGATPDGLTSNQQVLNLLYCLFKRGGGGFKQTERSTWITNQSGNFGEVPWPWSADANHDSWKGPIPADAIAFAHTHPSNMDPKPSTGTDRSDDLAANKTGLPNYVVTRDAIWKQSPNQKEPELVAGPGWMNDSVASEKKGDLKCDKKR